MAAGQCAAQYGAVAVTGRRTERVEQRVWRGTPEVYLPKQIDNSRLVKAHDPERAREMRQFMMACALLFLVLLGYAFQHFGSIEYGYKIEAQKLERDRLVEANRSLKLEEASLRDPERIDVLARRMGLQSPQAGQMVRIENAAGPQMPVLAQANIVVTSISE